MATATNVNNSSVRLNVNSVTAETVVEREDILDCINSILSLYNEFSASSSTTGNKHIKQMKDLRKTAENDDAVYARLCSNFIAYLENLANDSAVVTEYTLDDGRLLNLLREYKLKNLTFKSPPVKSAGITAAKFNEAAVDLTNNVIKACPNFSKSSDDSTFCVKTTCVVRYDYAKTLTCKTTASYAKTTNTTCTYYGQNGNCPQYSQMGVTSNITACNQSLGNSNYYSVDYRKDKSASTANSKVVSDYSNPQYKTSNAITTEHTVRTFCNTRRMEYSVAGTGTVKSCQNYDCYATSPRKGYNCTNTVVDLTNSAACVQKANSSAWITAKTVDQERYEAKTADFVKDSTAKSKYRAAVEEATHKAKELNEML